MRRRVLPRSQFFQALESEAAPVFQAIEEQAAEAEEDEALRAGIEAYAPIQDAVESIVRLFIAA